MISKKQIKVIAKVITEDPDIFSEAPQLLKESDVDIRSAERLASNGDPEAMARLRRLQQRAGLRDPIEEEKPGSASPSYLIYMSDMEDASQAHGKGMDSYAEKLEKWQDERLKQRFARAEGAKSNSSPDSPRPKSPSMSNLYGAGGSGADQRATAKSDYDYDVRAQAEWRRGMLRQGHIAVYNPELKRTPLTPKQEEWIESEWPKPWFIKAQRLTY